MRNHLRSLDGLRGLAAVMVMCFHYFQNPARLPAGAWGELIAKAGMIGQTGVDLFFVLSGFLITRILLDDKDNPRFFQHFYLKRTLRICPLYYFFLGLFLYVEPRLSGRHPPAFGECWWWFVHLQNIPPTFHLPASGPGHYWSLAVEEHFYLAWPLLVYWSRRRGLLIACGCLFAGSLATRWAFLARDWSVFYFTGTRLDALACGALLAIFEPLIKTHSRSARNLAASCLVLLGLMLGWLFIRYGGSAANAVQLFKYPLTAGFYAMLIMLALVSGPRSFLNRVFESPILVYLGGISYGLYVYHEMCYRVVSTWMREPSAGLSLIASFGLAIVAAQLSMSLLEAPCLRLKARLVPSRS